MLSLRFTSDGTLRVGGDGGSSALGCGETLFACTVDDLLPPAGPPRPIAEPTTRTGSAQGPFPVRVGSGAQVNLAVMPSPDTAGTIAIALEMTALVQNTAN